jgi:hypothetical protein
VKTTFGVFFYNISVLRQRSHPFPQVDRLPLQRQAAERHDEAPPEGDCRDVGEAPGPGRCKFSMFSISSLRNAAAIEYILQLFLSTLDSRSFVSQRQFQDKT